MICLHTVAEENRYTWRTRENLQDQPERTRGTRVRPPEITQADPAYQLHSAAPAHAGAAYRGPGPAPLPASTDGVAAFRFRDPDLTATS